MTLNERIEQRAKELIGIRNRMIPANPQDWYLLQNLIEEYKPIAKHTVALELKARIDSLKWSLDPTEGKSVDPYYTLEMKIKELEQQLKELEQ